MTFHWPALCFNRYCKYLSKKKKVCFIVLVFCILIILPFLNHKRKYYNINKLHAKQTLREILKTMTPPARDLPTHFEVPDILTSFGMNVTHIRALFLNSQQDGAWDLIHRPFKVIDPVEKGYFDKMGALPDSVELELWTSMKEIKRILPVNMIYHYAGSGYHACELMTSPIHAIYDFGQKLLNRTCQKSIQDVLEPLPVDEALLSIGLPEGTDLSSSHVLLTYTEVFQNVLLLHEGRVATPWSKLVQSHRCWFYGSRVDMPQSVTEVPLYDEVFSLTQQTKVWYYHSIVEDLTRISLYINFLLAHPNIKVHITSYSPHIKMLEYLGIHRDRLIDGEVRAKILYLPSGTRCGRPAVFPTQLLANLFRQRFLQTHPEPIKQDFIVIIHRSDPERQFKNHQQMVENLSEVAHLYNLTVMEYFDNPSPSLEGTIEIFQHARVVVAPHGAGLANLVFSQPGTLVVEGVCRMEPNWVFCWWLGFIPGVCWQESRFSLSFRNLATVLGHIYYGIPPKDSCLTVTAEEVYSPVKNFLKYSKLKDI